MLLVPLVASVPLHPPEAVQEFALVADQVSVELFPLLMLVGFAPKLTVGAGVAAVPLTETVVDCSVVPPVPVQDKLNVWLAVKAPVLLLPLVPTVPLQAPDDVQEVAFVEDQVKVALAPLLILVGLALIETVGAGVAAAAIVVTVTDCTAVPPVPVQVSVYSVVEFTAEVVFVPLTGTVPLQPPDAVQEVALVASQISLASLPLVI